MNNAKRQMLQGIAGKEETINALRAQYVSGELPLDEYRESVQTLRAEIDLDTLYLHYV